MKNLFVLSLLPLLGETSCNLISKYEFEDGGIIPKWSAPHHTDVFCVGNSITAGYTATVGLDWPSQMRKKLDTSYTVYNKGVGGITTTQLELSFKGSVLKYKRPGVRSILFFDEGRNDMETNNQDPVSTYLNIVSYCNTARQHGFEVVIVTLLPSWNAKYNGDATVAGYNKFEEDRKTVNQLICANWWSFADAIMDIGNDPTMGQSHQNENPGYVFISTKRPSHNAKYSDGTHPNQYGYGVFADYGFSTLKSM